jgi:hypothetical protein
MTREEIIKEYAINKHGVITSPGKFEGAMLYTPYFWDAYLNGMADDDNGSILTFIVNQDDRNEFPELAEAQKVRLEESEQGFVYCETR